MRDTNFAARRWRPFRPPLAELYRVQPDGCWRWLGSFHTATGTPQYKGWHSAKMAVYVSRKGQPPAGMRIGGMTCCNKWCVAPDHARFVVEPRQINSGKRDW